MIMYTKQTKEQLMGYLKKHDSSLTEAAKIAGISRTTFTRHLEEGWIPSEWYTKITATLKNRKPVKKKPKVECAACGKDISNDETLCATNDIGLAKLGVEPPNRGWYWSTKFGDEVPKQKMYRVCPECMKKAERVRKAVCCRI